MQFLKKAVLPLVAAAVAGLAFGAISAQAQEWDPGYQSWTGFSEDSTLEFKGVVLECPESNAAGTTYGKVPGHLTSLDFGPDPVSTHCQASSGSTITDVDVDTSEPWELYPGDPDVNGSGSVKFVLPDLGGPAATVGTSGIFANCIIAIHDDQETGWDSHWDAIEQELTVDVEVDATASHKPGQFCALAGSDTATFTGTYPRTDQGTDIIIIP